jgi:hypothetical protein
MMTTGSERPFSQLEREAEQNRAALVDTVDALHRKLSPTALKHEVQDYVRRRKESFVDNLEETARDYPLQTIAIAAGAAYPLWSLVTRIPVPLLLIGTGLALARRSNGGGQAQNGDAFGGEARGRPGHATDAAMQALDDGMTAIQEQALAGVASARQAADRLSSLKTQAAQSAGDFAARVGERVSGTAESLRGIGNDAAAMVTTERIQRAGRQSADWVNETVSHNPLIVGAVGLAIGAVIAAALPKTRHEDEFLGAAADGVKRRAQEAARAGVETAKGVGAEIYREAARHAEEEGLSVEGVKDAAGQVAERIRTAAFSAAGTQEHTQNPDDALSQQQMQQG